MRLTRTNFKAVNTTQLTLVLFLMDKGHPLEVIAQVFGVRVEQIKEQLGII